MTRNEKIAEKMGWLVIDGSMHDDTDWRNPQKNIYDAKLLQRRMVEDGWNVYIFHTCKFGISVRANSGELPGDHYHFGYEHWLDGWMESEPAAIVELFCKVYGITEEA